MLGLVRHHFENKCERTTSQATVDTPAIHCVDRQHRHLQAFHTSFQDGFAYAQVLSDVLSPGPDDFVADPAAAIRSQPRFGLTLPAKAS